MFRKNILPTYVWTQNIAYFVNVRRTRRCNLIKVSFPLIVGFILIHMLSRCLISILFEIKYKRFKCYKKEEADWQASLWLDRHEAKGRVVEVTDTLVVPKGDLAHTCCCIWIRHLWSRLVLNSLSVPQHKHPRYGEKTCNDTAISSTRSPVLLYNYRAKISGTRLTVYFKKWALKRIITTRFVPHSFIQHVH
jgi:hypothetical protein